MRYLSMFVLLTTAFSQDQASSPTTIGRVSFEVASVKPTANAGEHRPMRFAVSPGGQLTVANMPLHWLIANAYNVPFQSSRLTGGPGWVKSEAFDIQAVAPGMFAPGISANEREARTRLMLRALLAERFGLVVRSEVREMPAYVIAPVKKGPKLGKIVTEEKDCPLQPPDDGFYCHHMNGDMGRGLHGQAVDMSDIALYVENWMDRPVVDQTGIQGLYKIDTEGWISMTPLAPGQAMPTGPENVHDPGRPSVFTVFEETLGLKLEPKKAKVEMFVIERVERPSAN